MNDKEQIGQEVSQPLSRLTIYGILGRLHQDREEAQRRAEAKTAEYAVIVRKLKPTALAGITEAVVQEWKRRAARDGVTDYDIHSAMLKEILDERHAK